MKFCYFCWRLATESSGYREGRFGRDVWSCRKHGEDAASLALGSVTRMNLFDSVHGGARWRGARTADS